MSLAESQQFFYGLCADPKIIASFSKDRKKILETHFSTETDRRFLTRYPAERFRVYRNHVAIGFLGSIAEVFPVIRSLVSTEEWNDVLNNFYMNRLTRSPLARHVFDEFSEYLRNYEGPLLKRLPYLHELAEYERLDLRLVFAMDRPVNAKWVRELPSDPLQLVPVLNPHVEVRKYHWPVHKICKAYSSPQEVKRGEYPLIVYREPESLKVRFIEGNKLFADMIEQIRPGRKTVRGILQSLSRAYQIPKKEREVFTAEGVQTMALMRQKGIILGMKRSPS